MQLNELLEQYSIKEISSKTRIAPENLEYLHGRDWDMMRKVQALGFINILEREYGIDLSNLRKECLEYYSEHSQGLGGENLELHMEEGHKGSVINLFKKTVIFIFIAVLAAGSWYIFVENSKSEKNSELLNAKSGFYDSVMNMAHKLMGDSNESVTNELSLAESEENKKENSSEIENSEATAGNNTTITDEKSNEKIKLEYAKKPEEVSSDIDSEKNKSSENGVERTDPLKITDVIPTVTTKDNENSIITDESTVETVSKKNDFEIKSDDSNKESNNENVDDTSSMVSLLPEVPSLTTDNKSETETDKTETVVENGNNEEQKATDGAAVVIMEPGSKVWIGFRELRSGKRTAEVVTEPVKFDTKGSDYILATGHGILIFKNGKDKELLKMRDGKKHFFMIAKGGVREISHEKFQQLNGSKVW